MVIASITIVSDISSKVGCNQIFNIAAAATYHLDSLCLKDILRSLAHVSRKHNSDTHLS